MTLSPEQFHARTQELLLEEANEPLRWWYLSFADDKFIGVVVTKARGIISARMNCARLGINPGGQLMAVTIPDECKVPNVTDCDRLLNEDEVRSIWSDAKTLRELESEDLS